MTYAFHSQHVRLYSELVCWLQTLWWISSMFRKIELVYCIAPA